AALDGHGRPRSATAAGSWNWRSGGRPPQCGPRRRGEVPCPGIRALPGRSARSRRLGSTSGISLLGGSLAAHQRSRGGGPYPATPPSRSACSPWPFWAGPDRRMNYPVRKDDHHRFLEDAMQYALLIYAAPSSREDESRCDGGVFGSWIDYTQALKSAGALLEAEQLCHPAPALEVRVALTLRYLAGLRTREIANAFLVPEPTMAKRLGCPLPMPSDRDWRRFTGSSVSCSTRDTQPPAAIRWSEPSCAARPSGWDCCCTPCCRTTPRRPHSSRSCCCTIHGRPFGRALMAGRCPWRSRTERAGTTR